MLSGGRSDPLDPSSLSVTALLQTYESTKEYLPASGWHVEGNTFAPTKPSRLERVKNGGKLLAVQKFTTRVPRKRACGSGRVQELHHLSAVLPYVSPVYVMEVLTNPAYGVKWNPAIRRVVLRHHRRLHADENLPKAFPAEVMKTKSIESRLAKDSKDLIDVTAQVSEMPLPGWVMRMVGARFTADFIAARYDCEERRGFTLGTSRGAEDVAAAAGVRKAQELCISAVMIAPVTGAVNGTRIHIVTHFDPQVVSRTLRRVVNPFVMRSLKQMLGALHKKVQSVQQSRRHPFIDCPRQ